MGDWTGADLRFLGRFAFEAVLFVGLIAFLTSADGWYFVAGFGLSAWCLWVALLRHHEAGRQNEADTRRAGISTMKIQPTRLAEDGFLADEVGGVVAAVRARYSAHISEIRAINKLLTAAQYQLRIHQESAQELTCGVLFVRALAHCQAAVILVERGMLPSARAAARCAIEGLFNLGACAADWKIALSFVDADQVDRRRKAKYLGLVQDSTARATLEQSDLNEILKQVEATIAEIEARELRTRDMAKLADLEDMYLTAYAQLSGAVHSSIGDLDQHFRLDPSGERLELLTEPTVDNLNSTFLIIGETMVGLVRAARKVFDIDIADQCEQHLADLQKLYSAAG